jgi:hypothetical protein
VFECYNLTLSNPQDICELISLWERGYKDARIISHYLSNGVAVSNVVGNEQSGSKTITYLVSLLGYVRMLAYTILNNSIQSDTVITSS